MNYLTISVLAAAVVSAAPYPQAPVPASVAPVNPAVPTAAPPSALAGGNLPLLALGIYGHKKPFKPLFARPNQPPTPQDIALAQDLNAVAAGAKSIGVGLQSGFLGYYKGIADLYGFQKKPITVIVPTFPLLSLPKLYKHGIAPLPVAAPAAPGPAAPGPAALGPAAPIPAPRAPPS